MLGGFLFARLLGAFGGQNGQVDFFVGFAAVPYLADQKWQRVVCSRLMQLIELQGRPGNLHLAVSWVWPRS